jgi:hypothetical protein
VKTLSASLLFHPISTGNVDYKVTTTTIDLNFRNKYTAMPLRKRLTGAVLHEKSVLCLAKAKDETVPNY